MKLIDLKTKDGLKVTFCTLGAAIYSIYYQKDILTVTPKNKKDYLLEKIYHGKTIGPIANRIEKGQLTIDGTTYSYDLNEGENTLHGGHNGLSTKEWQYDLQRDGIVFTLVEKDCIYQVVYELKGMTLSIRFTATPRKPMPIALTNHCYFCLGESNLDGLSLQIKAHRFIESRKEDLIPLKEKDIPSCLDFNELKKVNFDIDNPYLKDHRSNGIDHSLVKDDDSPIILEGSKYRLEITSDFETVQLYSCNYPSRVQMINTKDETYQGIAIEPQDHFLKRKVYNQPYKRHIEYSFFKK